MDYPIPVRIDLGIDLDRAWSKKDATDEMRRKEISCEFLSLLPKLVLRFRAMVTVETGLAPSPVPPLIMGNKQDVKIHDANPLPTGVRAMAVLFALCGVYLGIAGAVMLLGPGTISMFAGAPLLFGLELSGLQPKRHRGIVTESEVNHRLAPRNHHM